MQRTAFHILRIGIGVTFLWVGYMIWRAPVAWGSVIQPWAMRFLSAPLKEVMLATAVMDIVVGVLMLLNRLVYLAGLAGAVHMVIILITVGIDSVTVRDIGLAGASAALAWEGMPVRWREMIAPLTKKYG